MTPTQFLIYGKRGPFTSSGPPATHHNLSPPPSGDAGGPKPPSQTAKHQTGRNSSPRPRTSAPALRRTRLPQLASRGTARRARSTPGNHTPSPSQSPAPAPLTSPSPGTPTCPEARRVSRSAFLHLPSLLTHG